MKLDSKLLLEDVLSLRLRQADPKLFNLVASERTRQQRGLSLVAAENITPDPVLHVLSSCLANKYCEGVALPRDHGSNKFLDRIEHVSRERALRAFNLSPDEWGVNVQPHSGTQANLMVCTALLKPHDRLMYFDLLDSGHFTIEAMKSPKGVAFASIHFQAMSYTVDQKTGRINYQRLEETAKWFKPKLIIAGSDSYPRDLDYQTFRRVADEVGAFLMADLGQVAGLVQADVINSPFPHCDVITVATHYTLRGPRAGLVFFRKGVGFAKTGGVSMVDVARRLSQGVFPGPDQSPGLMLSGRADQIASVAYALQQTECPSFKQYQNQIVKNAKALCRCLQRRGYSIVTGGTDTHLILVDLRRENITGKQAERVLERASITCSSSSVPQESREETPRGIILGTPSLTTRGMKEADMEIVADFVHRGIIIARAARTMVDSRSDDLGIDVVLTEDEALVDEIRALQREVEDFVGMFSFTTFHDLLFHK